MLSKLATFLTALLLTSCALFNPRSDEDLALDADPVARAARDVREGRMPASADGGDAWTNAMNAQVAAERPAPIFNRVTLGMDQPTVRSLWGNPQDVETAGYAGNGNERWTYSEGVASRYGLRASRVVYFEGGRVAGWETQ